MASMRQNIARALIKTRIGLTTRELAEDLQLKPAVISMDLAKMAIEETAIKGEYLEGEGQLWQITEKGVETYATKEDLEVKPKNKPLSEIKSVKMPEKSPLTQNEKTAVETVEVVPIVEESVLEQIENDPILELTGFQCDPSKYVEKFGNQVDSKIETTESELTGLELAEKRFNEMEIGTFEVFQLTDNLASSFIKLMQAKQAKPIENIDYKIATLESLADIYNIKISATLREIAADLRG